MGETDYKMKLQHPSGEANRRGSRDKEKGLDGRYIIEQEGQIYRLELIEERTADKPEEEAEIST